MAARLESGRGHANGGQRERHADEGDGGTGGSHRGAHGKRTAVLATLATAPRAPRPPRASRTAQAWSWASTTPGPITAPWAAAEVGRLHE